MLQGQPLVRGHRSEWRPIFPMLQGTIAQNGVLYSPCYRGQSLRMASYIPHVTGETFGQGTSLRMASYIPHVTGETFGQGTSLRMASYIPHVTGDNLWSGDKRSEWHPIFPMLHGTIAQNGVLYSPCYRGHRSEWRPILTRLQGTIAQNGVLYSPC